MNQFLKDHQLNKAEFGVTDGSISVWISGPQDKNPSTLERCWLAFLLTPVANISDVHHPVLLYNYHQSLKVFVEYWFIVVLFNKNNSPAQHHQTVHYYYCDHCIDNSPRGPVQIQKDCGWHYHQDPPPTTPTTTTNHQNPPLTLDCLCPISDAPAVWKISSSNVSFDFCDLKPRALIALLKFKSAP